MAARRDAPAGPFRYRHSIEIRFRDTDALGHVNNAVYLTYFEAARAGYYRAVTGSTFGSGEGAGAWTFIIARASVEYRSPALFGEPLVAECRIGWASRSSFSLEYVVSAEGSEVGEAREIADGETIQVMYDLEHQRATRIPSELIERLTAYERRPIPAKPAS